LRIGIHTSISGGFEKAVKYLAGLECNACQLFSRSPRGGKARVLAREETDRFRELCIRYDINPVVIHIPYVLNLATPDPEMHSYAVSMVAEDLKRADELGASYLVLHMGSHKGAGIDRGLAQVAMALKTVLNEYEGKTKVLLENTAGAGTEVGSVFEELARVLEEVGTDKAGVCFDTCHGYAAGYDLSDDNSVQKVFSDMDNILGLSNLMLIHANDAMFPLGSKKDRHAHIGLGHIGETGFRAILTHPGLQLIPVILETPVDEQGNWETNLKTIRKLANNPRKPINSR